MNLSKTRSVHLTDIVVHAAGYGIDTRTYSTTKQNKLKEMFTENKNKIDVKNKLYMNFRLADLSEAQNMAASMNPGRPSCVDIVCVMYFCNS